MSDSVCIRIGSSVARALNRISRCIVRVPGGRRRNGENRDRDKERKKGIHIPICALIFKTDESEFNLL